MNDAQVLEALVRIPSPTGHEAAAVAFMQDQARADGLRVQTDNAGNFIAEAGRGSRLLLFVGHIDTVPGHIPVRVKDGELWGRGSVDAKGCLAAAYAAARKRLDDADFRILIVGAVDEEGDSKGAMALPRDLRPEAIVVGEPSGTDALTLGYKGILRGRLTLEKAVQHGGHPGHGAVESFIDCWSQVRAQMQFADGFGTLQGRLDNIRTEHDGLHDTVHAKLQIRLPPDATPEGVSARLQAIAGTHGASFAPTESLAAHVASRRNKLVASFLSSQRALGLEPRFKHKTGTADFNHLAVWWPDVPILAYGPGDSSLDHTPEERLGLQEFSKAVSTWDGALDRLAAAGKGS